VQDNEVLRASQFIWVSFVCLLKSGNRTRDSLRRPDACFFGRTGRNFNSRKNPAVRDAAFISKDIRRNAVIEPDSPRLPAKRRDDTPASRADGALGHN
jgi:hypothetical protein